MGITLVATHPQHGTRRCSFEGDREANVGRGPKNHLVLPSDFVDEWHARVLFRDGRTIITDLRSQHGTHIDGRRIVQATIVRLNNVITIGDWTIRLDEGVPLVAPAVEFAPRSPREEQLVRALAANPGDDGLRCVYGRWLAENGHTREAEVLAIEHELRERAWTMGEGERAELNVRLRALKAVLPFQWRALATGAPIAGCSEDERCPRSWDRLLPTNQIGVRTCGACARAVVLSETDDLARVR